MFGVNLLGYGTTLEAFLSLVCFIFGVSVILDPYSIYALPNLGDIVSSGYERLWAIPFFLKSLLSGFGIYAVKKNLVASQAYRIPPGGYTIKDFVRDAKEFSPTVPPENG
jgi:hypothetical protein